LLIDHRRADDVRSRRDLDAEAARIGHRELVAVEGDVDPAAATASPSGAAAGHAELVLGIERKRMADEHAAARAERQALDMAILRESPRDRIRDLGRRERPVADGLAADFHRRRHIPLDQRW
jgi:hypothetical protein